MESSTKIKNSFSSWRCLHRKVQSPDLECGHDLPFPVAGSVPHHQVPYASLWLYNLHIRALSLPSSTPAHLPAKGGVPGGKVTHRRIMPDGSQEQTQGHLGRENTLEGDMVSWQLCSLGSMDTSPHKHPEQSSLFPRLDVVLPCKTEL